MGKTAKDDKPINKSKNTVMANARVVSSQAEVLEQRNVILPSKEGHFEEVLAEVRGYQKFLDTSPLEENQIDSQKAVLRKVVEAIESNPEHNVLPGLAILLREDINWTDQLYKIAASLIRQYELDRTGTTDLMPLPEAKDFLRDETFYLLKFYHGNDKNAALFILKNVENAESGTVQMDLVALHETRKMVQDALKFHLKKNFEAGLAPHPLEGAEVKGTADQHPLKGGISPIISAYIRVFETLNLVVIRQQENSLEQQSLLLEKRLQVGESLKKLSQAPGINISAETFNEFQNKMSKMKMNPLMFLDCKILDLLNRVIAGQITAAAANGEVDAWLSQTFDKNQLHNELEQRKRTDRDSDSREVEDLRNRLAA